MDDLIKKHLVIEEADLSHDEALNYFNSINHKYSASLVENNNADVIKCSCLENFYSLLFRPLGKSTGIINDFDVRLSNDKSSLLLLFPTNSNPIPKDLKNIETKLTTQSYLDSFKYNKSINIEFVGYWYKIVISSLEKT